MLHKLQVGHKVVVRATMCFNLQCSNINVARKIEEKCCPYYLTFSKQRTRNGQRIVTQAYTTVVAVKVQLNKLPNSELTA